MSEVNTQANEPAPLIDLDGLGWFKDKMDIEIAKKNDDVNLSVVNGEVCITYTEST